MGQLVFDHEIFSKIYGFDYWQKQMSLKKLYWNGEFYSLSIRRHWNTFFGLATIFEIKNQHVKKLLPEGAGYHIIGIYDLCESSKDYFQSFDDWWSFSKKLCDQYCDFYVMERPNKNNTFNVFHSTYINDRYAVQNLAKISRGYIGPEKWDIV